MPFGKAIYGATILGYTNALQCVVSVDNSQFLKVGSRIIIANVVNTLESLNGKYEIVAISGLAVTINKDTTLIGPYISGGFMAIEEQPNLVSSLQADLIPKTIPWVVFNQARGGGTIPLV